MAIPLDAVTIPIFVRCLGLLSATLASARSHRIAATVTTLEALPNFFFHLSMAHAILRSRGVPVGKQDFDGWHAYPPGFSFGEPDARDTP